MKKLALSQKFRKNYYSNIPGGSTFSKTEYFNDCNVPFALSICKDAKVYDVDKNKFPSVKLLKLISSHNTLFDTVLVSVNDELVDLFLNKKIHFMKIYLIIKKILNLKEFSKYKYLYPKNVDQIYKLDKYVRLKTKSFCINYLK